jgi:hypothetical protein
MKVAYKLFRKRKNGTLGPLFINKRQIISPNKWLRAEAHPTKGFTFRPYWHCCPTPNAPHISMEGRVWCVVEVKGIKHFQRPEAQGGLWYLAKHLKLIGELSTTPTLKG